MRREEKRKWTKGKIKGKIKIRNEKDTKRGSSCTKDTRGLETNQNRKRTRRKSYPHLVRNGTAVVSLSRSPEGGETDKKKTSKTTGSNKTKWNPTEIGKHEDAMCCHYTTTVPGIRQTKP